MSYQTMVDGIHLDNPGLANPNPGIQSGRKWKVHGQTGNTVAASVANKGLGTVALPAIAAGATGTVTIADSLIAAASIVKFLGLVLGTTTPGASTEVYLRYKAQPTTGQVVWTFINKGSVASLATDLACQYEVVN